MDIMGYKNHSLDPVDAESPQFPSCAIGLICGVTGYLEHNSNVGEWKGVKWQAHATYEREMYFPKV